MTGQIPTDAEILAGIAAVAREQLDWNQPLLPEQRLIEELELDSVRMLTLAIEVENYFRIYLDEQGDGGIETVADLVAAVRTGLESKTEPEAEPLP